jgi:hypothetical protein
MVEGPLHLDGILPIWIIKWSRQLLAISANDRPSDQARKPVEKNKLQNSNHGRQKRPIALGMEF